MNRRIRKKKDKKITEAINGLVSIAERREQQRQAAIRPVSYTHLSSGMNCFCSSRSSLFICFERVRRKEPLR